MKTRVFFMMMLFIIVSGIDVCQAQELWRVDGCIAGNVWMEDERHPNLYWCVDTTKVGVQVEISEMPKDIGWTIDSDGKTQAPVPNDVRIEDFVTSLRAFSWVKNIWFYREGSVFGKKYLQTISEGKEWPLVRVGGKAWIEDYTYENYYWEVDTTRVQVHVYDLSEVPEDITWNFSKWGFASVPVPEDVMIEDFMASIRAYPWVVSVEYNTYGSFDGPTKLEIDEKKEIVHPFIENNKTWHLHGAHFGGQSWMTDYVFTEEKRTEANGKTYQVMYKKEKGDTTEVALLREEDGRVYTYNPDAGTEQLIYDFTLKEGDTFQLDIPQLGQTTCDVLHVGQIVQQGEVLKTITYGYPVYYGEGIEAEVMEHTWIEGIGSKGTPLSYYPNTTPNSMRGYLAYVSSEEHFYPFSFNDIWTGWRGQGLQRGEDLSYQVSEEQWGHDDLHYEILPGQPWGDDKDTLHVYGNMWIACGGDSYIYCRENTATHELSLELEYATLATPCLGYFVVDIRFPFFSATSGVKYMVTDAEGTHAVELRKEESTPYRPFIEDGKVWTVKWEDKLHPDAYYYIYYFFTKDVVVNGKPCKKMAYKYDFRPAEEAGYGHIPETGGDAGTYYEEDKRVYSIWSGGTPLLMYDFEAGKGDTIHVYSQSDKKVAPFVIDGKTLEESESFKGISTRLRSVLRPDGETDTWMEGVGWMTRPVDDGNNGGNCYLMACTVGDEVLYKHPDWTIDESEALGKKRVDFTHVIKTKPKSPQQRTEKVGNGMISGEYSMNVLAIDLGTLHDAYTVTIKASSGNVLYTKEVKTSRVLALNIDIAEYADGDYTITVENNREIFTGLFNLSRPNAIEEVPCAHPVGDNALHDLTGRPVAGYPQRGVYIRNGKKCWVK